MINGLSLCDDLRRTFICFSITLLAFVGEFVSIMVLIQIDSASGSVNYFRTKTVNGIQSSEISR